MNPAIHIFEDRWIFGVPDTSESLVTSVEEDLAALVLRENCVFPDSNKEEISSQERYHKKLQLVRSLSGANILLIDLKYDNPMLDDLPATEHPKFESLRGIRELPPDGTRPAQPIRDAAQKTHALYLIEVALSNSEWFGHIRIVSSAGPQNQNRALIDYLFAKLNRNDVSFSYSMGDDLVGNPVGEVEIAIAEFKKAQGSVHARLLPPTAQRWFAVNNPNPAFMHHDWPEAKSDQDNALAELTRYFCGLSGGSNQEVRQWLQQHVEAKTISKLWNNLKTVVGVGSLVHCAKGNRFLWFPALAFVLSACCKRNGFTVLTSATFPNGMQICDSLSRSQAFALMSAIIKCFSALANGDGREKESGEPLVKSCETAGAYFAATFDIPFEQVNAKLQELETRNIDEVEISGCCGPLLKVQQLFGAFPPACLDVSSSREGKTVVAIKLRKEVQ